MVDLGSNPNEDIFERVRDYLQGQTTLRELEDWIGPWTLHFLNQGVSANKAVDLHASFELGISELTDKVITERQLRETLQAQLLDNPLQSKER